MQGFKGGHTPDAQKAVLAMMTVLSGPETIGAPLLNKKKLIEGEADFHGLHTYDALSL